MLVVTEKVDKGSGLAEVSGKALQNLLSTADDMNTQATGAKSANENLLNEMNNLNQAIGRVSAVIEENRFFTQEIAGHANETMQIIESVAALSQEKCSRNAGNI